MSPCTGPSKYTADECAKFVADALYDEIKRCRRYHRAPVFNTLVDMYRVVLGRDLVAENAIIHALCDSIDADFNRHKYALMGYLAALFPLVEHSYEYDEGRIASGVTYDPTRFNQLTKEQFESELADLFFYFDCEDF